MSSSAGRTTLDVGADGVAIITIINPPVNSLSFDGMIILEIVYCESSDLLLFLFFDCFSFMEFFSLCELCYKFVLPLLLLMCMDEGLVCC